MIQSKKIGKAILAILLVLSVLMGLCSCGSEPEEKVELSNIPDKLAAIKIGTTKHTVFQLSEGGLYYEDKDTGLWGVASFNGKNDTGAVYSYLRPKKDFFEVGNTVPTSYNDIAALNSFGLIDGNGKSVVPCNYAAFEILNDRYIKVMKVTERTFDKDEALIYYTENNFSISAGDDDILFKGTWEVYDIKASKTVTGVTSETTNSALAYGNFVKYNKEGEGYISVNSDGEVLSCEKLFDDGSYSVEERVGSVFSTDGKHMFDYDLTGFIPSRIEDDYYIASKNTDDGRKYVVMDKTGAIVSSEFENDIDLHGTLIKSEDYLYNFEGKKVVDDKVGYVTYDKVFDNCWMYEQKDHEDTYVMINEKGSVLFKDKDDDETSIFTSDFVAYTKKDDENYYYSHKDKDYTIKGSIFAPWLIKTYNANDMYDVVDTISGEKLFESYTGYTSHKVEGKSLYVYAKYNGGTDIYQILMGSQLDAVEQKRKDLLNDLVAAFKNDGINVNVDEETGELALESSVLFGGDSAELTADGKAFLDKFIKSYTSIVFSEKYEGFISNTLIEGHTAPVAGSTYESGYELSKQRADNVKNYSVSAQSVIDATRFAEEFEAIGYSNSLPVLNDDGSVNMEASRRVSFRFMVNI